MFLQIIIYKRTVPPLLLKRSDFTEGHMFIFKSYFGESTVVKKILIVAKACKRFLLSATSSLIQNNTLWIQLSVTKFRNLPSDSSFTNIILKHFSAWEQRSGW